MLCRTGSFPETAKHLFLTQSTVSHSMKNLEEEAGTHLSNFVRPFLFEMENVRD